MDSVIAQVQHLASNTDKAERMKIIDELRELSYSLESPEDTLSRISYLVSPYRDVGVCFCLIS